MKKIFTIIFLASLCAKVKASEIVEVLPLTNKIILVHFDDGYVQQHTSGQKRSDDIVFDFPLAIPQATTLSTYLLSSTNDVSYNTAKNPFDFSRKSKGTEFAWYCDGWNGACVNNRPDHIKEHWIYLIFSEPMKSGKQYTLTTGSLASNTNTFNFIYDEKKLRSEAVHVNMVGYASNNSFKAGYIYQWMGSKGSLNLSAYANKVFRLVDTTNNQTVFTGQVTFRKAADNNEFAYYDVCLNGSMVGAEVYECNFSTFCVPGNYRLVVDSMGCSYPFEISNTAYSKPFELVTKHIYHHRSGIALEPPYTTFTRPAPHRPGVTPGFANRLKYTSTRYYDLSDGDASNADLPLLQANIKGNIDAWGWYQDAGDWDAYFSHSRVPIYLLFTFENGITNFTDGELNIPESGNGIPDILDEARWLIRFHHRLKYELLSKNFGTGGVGGGRIAGDWNGGDTKADGTTVSSFQDTHRDWIATGEDPHMTYMYAALAAHYAYCLRLINKTDPENINWQQEAIDAFTWAQNNTTATEESTPKHGMNIKHIRLYAAASIFKLTGITSYNTKFIEDIAPILTAAQLVDQNDLRWGLYSYATMPNNINANEALRAQMDSTIKFNADFFVYFTGDKRAMRWVGNYWKPMNTGQPTTPSVFELIMAYHRTKNTEPVKASEYLKYIYTSCDYYLGNNPQNATWVSGLGEKSPKGIFHIDSWYSGADIWPGNVPYGPWRNSGDPNVGQGPWSTFWAYKTIFPTDIYVWPGHEQWFSQKTVPLGNENTIHENQAPAAAAYGFLKGNPTVGANSPCATTVLPVSLQTFMVTKDNSQAKLFWKTSDEINNVGFEIERSQNGNDTWKKIGFVPSQSNNNMANYTFTDIAVLKGNNFYRLKQIDQSGLYKYSDIKMVNFYDKVKSIIVYPSITNENINIEVVDDGLLNTNLQIVNTSGQVIKTIQLKNTKMIINLANQPAGIYFLKTENGITMKIVKI
jgi:endoglucanase